VKNALIISGISEDKFRAIIAEVNQDLVAVNMTSFHYDNEAVLERALANKTMWADPFSVFNKVQQRVCPLSNGYSADKEWQKITISNRTLYKKYCEKLDILREQCKYIQGWPGLTNTQLQKHERTCHICKECIKATTTYRANHDAIKQSLNKIEDNCNMINRARNDAVLTIARRTYYAPYKK